MSDRSSFGQLPGGRRRRERQDPALCGEQQGERVVGDLVGAVVRDVADRDAGGLGGRPVHLVHPDAVAQDPDGPLQAGDAAGVEAPVAGDDHGVRGPDRFVGRGGVLGHDEVDAPLAQDLDLRSPRRGTGDRVEDDDARAGRPASVAVMAGPPAAGSGAQRCALAERRPARSPSTSSAAWSMRATSSSECAAIRWLRLRLSGSIRNPRSVIPRWKATYSSASLVSASSNERTWPSVK